MIHLAGGFTAKINTTGTHIQKDFLKVRFDIYPPVGSKTYVLHYVDHLDREPTEEELADSQLPEKDQLGLMALISTHKELNPCLCHFIKVSPETTDKQLDGVVRGIFDNSTLSQLDDSLSTASSLTSASSIMRHKKGEGRGLTKNEQTPMLIAMMNTRFGDM